MTAGSSSGPSREAPTEVTCIPGSSDSAREDRLPRIGAGTDDVRSGDGLFERGARGPADLVGERLGVLSAAARDAHLGETLAPALPRRCASAPAHRPRGRPARARPAGRARAWRPPTPRRSARP